MNYYLVLGFALFCYMMLWFVASLILRKNDIADIAWGLGFVGLAWGAYFLSGNYTLRGEIVTILTTLWGFRLAVHIYKRNKGKEEDYRYAKWRNDWGKWFYIRSFLQVYLLQGILLYMIMTPILFVHQQSGNGFGVWDIIGLIVWFIGFGFEVIGDTQLKKFIKNPKNKGKIIQSGLWQYSRHPNYFGEVFLWWGIWILTFSISGFWWTILGPITITILILKVSGIPLLEKRLKQKAGYEKYAKRVSCFIPLPPKK